MDVDPLGLFLVKSEFKGDLLFRYPYEVSKPHDTSGILIKKNPYSLIESYCEELQGTPPSCFSLDQDCLVNFSDDMLANLFAVKQELCEKKFELKVNDVRFVGHPTMILPCKRRGRSGDRPVFLVNLVFALRATASHSVVKCYHELCKRFGIAWKHEERRIGYVYDAIHTMITAHDYWRSEDITQARNPFEVILEQCSMARDLQKAYNDMKASGLVQLRVNKWIFVSFCLPQKVHQLHNRALMVEPDDIDKCLESIRPYHGVLLLVPTNKYIESLPPDASPALERLLKMYTPLKSLQTLSADADLTLLQVFQLCAHMVYWGKAIFIYPICETNVYIAAPKAPIHFKSRLTEKFSEQFPGRKLMKEMSQFSLPTTTRHKISPMCSDQKQEIRVIIWLLQQRLIMQLHTYLYHFMPESTGSPSENVGKYASGDETGLDIDHGTKFFIDNNMTHYTPKHKPKFGEQKKVMRMLILMGYLQGKHHLEEIMYKLNLHRSQLMEVVERYHHILFTREAQDPVLSIFYPKCD